MAHSGNGLGVHAHPPTKSKQHQTAQKVRHTWYSPIHTKTPANADMPSRGRDKVLKPMLFCCVIKVKKSGSGCNFVRLFSGFFLGMPVSSQNREFWAPPHSRFVTSLYCIEFVNIICIYKNPSCMFCEQTLEQPMMLI